MDFLYRNLDLKYLILTQYRPIHVTSVIQPIYSIGEDINNNQIECFFSIL